MPHQTTWCPFKTLTLHFHMQCWDFWIQMEITSWLCGHKNVPLIMLCVCAQNSKATENLLAMEYLLWPDRSAGTFHRITVTWKQGGLNNALERFFSYIFVCFFLILLAFWFLSASSSLVLVVLLSVLSFCHLTVLSSTEIGVWGWVLRNTCFLLIHEQKFWRLQCDKSLIVQLLL